MIESKLNILTPSPCEPFINTWKNAENLNIYVKRDDLIHPIISGNKWRKLKYAISGIADSTSRIISFGGGYSNHLHALGYVCYQLSLPFTAIIRGDYSSSPTPMISDLLSWKSEILYVSKKEYRLRESQAYLEKIHRLYADAVIIPEGGKQHCALKGVGEILEELTFKPDYVMVPVGSGATLAGLIPKLDSSQQITGVAVLKGEGYLEKEVEALLPSPLHNWKIEHRFHHGGYAKSSHDLKHFCETFNKSHQFEIEPVYTGKLFYAAQKLIESGYFRKGANLLLIHTGGLQGTRNILTTK